MGLDLGEDVGNLGRFMGSEILTAGPQRQRLDQGEIGILGKGNAEHADAQ